jgi:hypothetical protein
MHTKIYKAILISLFTVAGSSLSIAQGPTTLFGLGSISFDIELSQGSYSQSQNSISWQGNLQVGDFVGGIIFPGPLDLSSYIVGPFQFAIEMSITGTNPSVPFTVQFFDLSFNTASFSGSTASITSGVVPLAFLAADSGFSFANIFALELAWDASGSEAGSTIVATNVVAIPEPSSALFVGLAAAGFFLLRRRRQRAL